MFYYSLTLNFVSILSTSLAYNFRLRHKVMLLSYRRIYWSYDFFVLMKTVYYLPRLILLDHSSFITHTSCFEAFSKLFGSRILKLHVLYISNKGLILPGVDSREKSTNCSSTCVVAQTSDLGLIIVFFYLSLK